MFDTRARTHERLDEAVGTRGYGGLSSASYAAMNTSSRYLGSIRTVQNFIYSEAQRLKLNRPIRVLDIGAGMCDISESIVRFMQSKSMPLHITCLDTNPYAINLAKCRLNEEVSSHISVRCESIEEHKPDKPYDCAVGSLFFHHYHDTEILELMEHLRQIVQFSVFINDLRRCGPAFIGLLLLGPFIHSGVWHDSLMSVRRGFRTPRLRNLLGRLHNVEVKVRYEYFFRVTARVHFIK